MTDSCYNCVDWFRVKKNMSMYASECVLKHSRIIVAYNTLQRTTCRMVRKRFIYSRCTSTSNESLSWSHIKVGVVQQRNRALQTNKTHVCNVCSYRWILPLWNTGSRRFTLTQMHVQNTEHIHLAHSYSNTYMQVKRFTLIACLSFVYIYLLHNERVTHVTVWVWIVLLRWYVG